ncbi:MAG: hypothetical protein AB7T31_11220 [Gemmatimonadales bacterium]
MKPRAVTASAAVLAVLGICLVLGGRGAALRGQEQTPFPHLEHQGLFPLCAGCHEGIPEGDTATFYPPPASCTGCHDGVREERVTWNGPTDDVDNVAFQHDVHDAELAAAGDPPQECASCHVEAGGTRMAVADDVQLAGCWSCHAHQAADHMVDADCVTCHVPLASTRFDLARIADLPLPADHGAAEFLAGGHGPLAEADAGRCATCHTQERCVSCHVDTERASIAAVPAAPADMELPVTPVHYDVPVSHTDRDFLATHGAGASLQACGTCHTSNDCTTCHIQPLPVSVSALPDRANVLAPGAQVVGRAPSSHESMFFIEAHATLAAANETSCATCHEESFCVSCHDAPSAPSTNSLTTGRGGGYHPASFLSMHAASAFGRDSDCATCHSTQVFCRQCHLETGLVPAGGGRLGPGYHDDGPLWLLRHGQAARQNLEGCTSCHRQVDCTQCHGVLGAFKVSPHTLGFDAERAWARSPRTCLACHVGNPLG